MQRKGCNHQFAIPEFIGHKSTDNNAKAKPGETGSPDRSQLSTGKSKFGTPVVEDTATDTKTYAGSQNGHKTGPQ